MSEIVKQAFASGVQLVRAGEPADRALLITEGRVAVAVNGGATEALLGPGATVGELAAVLGTHYDYTASAIEPVMAIAIPRWLLVDAALAAADRVRPLARSFITELAPALRGMMLEGGEAASRPTVSWQRMFLTADNPRLMPQLPTAGLPITRLPFRVGRGGRNGRAGDAVELMLQDDKPYKLSRQHFTIDATREGPIVRDRTSSLGTVVNGERIGAKQTRTTAKLRPGRNTILAGSESSPFRFILAVEGL